MVVDMFAMCDQMKQTLSDSNLSNVNHLLRDLRYEPGLVIYWQALVGFHRQIVKVNADYYSTNVLRSSVLQKTYRACFLDDMTACSHTSKKNPSAFLNKRKMKFITPAEWMPMSTDVAPV